MQMVLVAAALAAQMTYSQPASIKDSVSHMEAYRRAQHSGRALFVTLEDHNSVSGQLSTLNDRETSRRLSNTYQVCRIDVNTPYGLKIAQSYGASQFPYSVITDGDGQVIYRRVGQLDGVTELPGGKRTICRRPTQPADAIVDSTSVSDTSRVVDEVAFRKMNLGDALKRARRSNRKLVAFVTTKSCHYCEKMKQESLIDPHVQSKVTQRFVSARIDGDRNRDWVNQHGIRLYPTTLILSSEGTLLDRIEGYVTADQLEARLDQADLQLISQR